MIDLSQSNHEDETEDDRDDENGEQDHAEIRFFGLNPFHGRDTFDTLSTAVDTGLGDEGSSIDELCGLLDQAMEALVSLQMVGPAGFDGLRLARLEGHLGPLGCDIGKGFRASDVAADEDGRGFIATVGDGDAERNRRADAAGVAWNIDIVHRDDGVVEVGENLEDFDVIRQWYEDGLTPRIHFGTHVPSGSECLDFDRRALRPHLRRIGPTDLDGPRRDERVALWVGGSGRSRAGVR